MKDSQFDIATFKKHQEEMIVKNRELSSGSDLLSQRYMNRVRDYSIEEIDTIINSGSVEAQRRLSRNYFDKDGFYKRIILYYATILKYNGILIPNPAFGKKLSENYIQKHYYSALEYIDRLNLPELLTRMSIYALINGSYFGAITTLDKETFAIIDLPSGYCRSRFKDFNGNDIVEFNVEYFFDIVDLQTRAEALKSYPKEIRDWFKKWTAAKVTTPWVRLPAEIGICFSFFDDGRPLFLNVIPATIIYDDAVDTDRERELEEIRKIIVQKIPHLTDGQLLFEPDEAVEMHAGAVGMLKGNQNISVMTTYADVEAIGSRTSPEAQSNHLQRMRENIYAEANASMLLFSPTGAQALLISITNDMTLMMILANKYSRFISFILNKLFANVNVNFKYEILPISFYNQNEYITDAMRLAQTGYSFLLPSIAMDVNQRSLVNLKSLENDVLKLQEVLIPLSSSYTQSADSNNDGIVERGRPKKKLQEKAEKTIKNEESIDNQGGFDK